MSKDEKRYVVKMDMYIYAENDYMARKRAHQMKKEIDDKFGGGVGILELGEQPFASFNYRKLEDHSEPISKQKQEELPF
tara:strand:+ start:649 stop:885 length:237 start_codon:yes stop_codon:yes gene_type:complete